MFESSVLVSYFNTDERIVSKKLLELSKYLKLSAAVFRTLVYFPEEKHR